MKKIVIVREMLKSGGGGCTMILWLANQLKKYYDVTFLFIYEDCVEKDLVCDFKVKYLTNRFPHKWLNRLKFVTIDYVALMRTINKINPDLVISFGNSSLWEMALAKKFCNFKMLVSERRDPNSNRSLEERFVYQCYKLVDSVVFQSEGARQIFANSHLKRSTVIPNPVKIPNFQWELSNTDLSIANVARLELVAKRQDLLIDAMTIIVKKYPSATLHLYGDGEDKEIIRQKIEEKHLENNIFLHGNVRNVKEKLLKHRVFAFSSDYEGVPNALLEAMSVGMPVVSTDCSPGGAKMLLGSNEYGLLVSRGNAKAIADSILAYFESDDLAKTYGSKARTSCVRFSEEKISELWRNEIDKIINN